ncbi:hypothetical protein NH8B_2112 [Pseudogulbenkiania sp. NH8B]|uniref:DUF7210 family protein n=1 Tax=Pseudogulbenkiania sp. (strain NH8B) TaxID=748280 RepID=UPI0002279B5D|nr:hypothetical protein [Pseudogulbenkiania sp. NH8B]BAK76498.1 hypothetical protein NH8B_1681 [Pseudogulbenkiania sp. NH8B]BAK76927.1 hypothetical protein NH8B_2112 [Pseudogulbenkiania sp. NH8B]
MADPTPVRVKLLKAHRHAGADHQEGAVLTMSPATATWLKNNRIAVDADTATEAATVVTVKPKEAHA